LKARSLKALLAPERTGLLLTAAAMTGLAAGVATRVAVAAKDAVLVSEEEMFI
jgi:hypothetical protein